jgi:FkbM family methyltransferase
LLTNILFWEGGGEKIVIDIGANLGDSSLFFAKKGFKVIGFEPLNKVYEIALENIKLNNLEGKITLVNKGVGAKKGFNCIIMISTQVYRRLLTLKQILRKELKLPQLMKLLKNMP